MGTGSTCGFVSASLSRRHLRGPRRMVLSANGRSRLPRAIRGKEVIVRRVGNGVWLELHPKRTTSPGVVGPLQVFRNPDPSLSELIL
jgi:hypothetical protein